jgi:hypothetical protein
VTASVIILEEAARIDAGVFYEVVVPLMGVLNTATLAISTPMTNENFYSELFDMKDEKNEALFHCVKLSKVCEDCRKIAKQDLIECPHSEHLQPPWKPLGYEKKMKTLMQHNPDLFARENLGEITSSVLYAFPRDYVKNLEESKPWSHPTFTPPHAFIAVDPTGAGTSRMAIVSGFFHTAGQLIITGVDAEHLHTDEKQRDLVERHLEMLVPMLPSKSASQLVAIIEADLSCTQADTVWTGMSNYIKNEVKEMHIVPMRHRVGKEWKMGVCTGGGHKERKAEMVHHLNMLLRFNNVVFHKDFFCTSVDRSTNKRITVAAARSQLIKELQTFKRHDQPADNPFAKPKTTFSGKNLAAGQSDDIAMALMILVMNSALFCTQPEYAKWR